MALRYRVLLAVATAVPLVLATACSGGGNGNSGSASGLPSALSAPGSPIPSTPAPGSQSLSETGSTLLAQLMGTWAAAYHRQYPNVSITTAGTGSGKGISQASEGKVDIGASDAYLSSGDLVQNPALLNIPLAISAQQVDYNLPGLSPSVHLRLDGPVLARMYEGTIRAWNDPAIAALNPRVALPATTTCRAATGACDLAETCDGLSFDCAPLGPIRLRQNSACASSTEARRRNTSASLASDSLSARAR